MKRLFTIPGVILLVILLIFILGTSRVKRVSYLEEDYFLKTAARIDSLKSVVSIRTDSIQAGFSRISLTPVLGAKEDNYREGKFMMVPLAGYGDRKGKPATGLHDSIFVKAVALKSGEQTIILVSADILIMPPNVTDSACLLLQRKGIKRDQLIFSATHTHSSLGGWGPGVVGQLFAGKNNRNIERWISQQITKAVTGAIEDLRPASAGTGSFNARNYTRNRLTGDNGTINGDFSFIVIQQDEGRKAVIGSFPAHATTMGDDNMEISSDYPGYWERKTEAAIGGPALFFAGSTGSQSPEGKGNGFDRPKIIGEALADSMFVHLPEIKMSSNPSVAFVSLKPYLPEYHIRLTTRINLSSFLSRKLMPEPVNARLQALRIGELVWFTTPCDFSGEYALQIKNAMSARGFETAVSSFNGSYTGYIIPGKYFYLDEYESKTMGWFGPTMGDYTMDILSRLSDIVTVNQTIMAR